MLGFLAKIELIENMYSEKPIKKINHPPDTSAGRPIASTQLAQRFALFPTRKAGT
jgi:hypothetical protein